MSLFGRVWAVQAAAGDGEARVWTELRTEFSVGHKRGGRPNPSTITITNLSPDSRAFLSRPDIAITLRAGYNDDRNAGVLPVVIRGDQLRADHERKGVDWRTELQVADGERVRRSVRVSLSSTGQTRLDLLRQCVGSNIVLQDSPAFSDPVWQEQYVGALAGSLDRVVSEVLPSSYSWMIQDGEVVVIPPGGELDPRLLIASAETGLIGIPRPKVRTSGRSRRVLGVEAKLLLYAPLRPGRLVELQSDAYSGVYTVAEVTHEGDSHGQSWFSDVLLQERA